MSTEKIRQQNRESVAKYQKTEKYRQKIRQRWYQQRYGISLEEYEKLHKEQEGVCKICKFPETAKTNTRGVKPLAVDHCHKTGKVRGLLCHSCNVLLGRAYDNVDILQNAIKYLQED